MPVHRISIRLHARAGELAGRGESVVDAPEGARCADVKRALAHAHPALAGLLGSCALASDTEFLPDAAAIPVSGTLHLIPPVSGG